MIPITKNPKGLYKHCTLITEYNTCPICGTNAIHSKHNDRDWYNISCNDPTCLTPSTGWMSRKMAYSKWLENHNKIKKKVINAQNK